MEYQIEELPANTHLPRDARVFHGVAAEGIKEANKFLDDLKSRKVMWTPSHRPCNYTIWPFKTLVVYETPSLPPSNELGEVFP